MKSPLKYVLVSILALLMSVAAFAQSPESSTLAVSEPLDVGGTILDPGVYVIRVLPSLADRNKVQITSTDMKTIYATVLTVPHDLEPGEDVNNTTFVYFPAGDGMPRALRTWFAPHPDASGGGHDIVYEESRAQQLARLAKSSVVSYRTADTSDLDTTVLHVITPEAKVETYVAPKRVVVTRKVETHMETAPMTSGTQVAEARPLKMPRTASRLPFVALLGLLSLAGAFALRMTGR